MNFIKNISGIPFTNEIETIIKMVDVIPESKKPKKFPDIFLCASLLQAFVESVKGKTITEEIENKFLEDVKFNTRAFYHVENKSIYIIPLVYNEECILPFEFILFHEIGHCFFIKGRKKFQNSIFKRANEISEDNKNVSDKFILLNEMFADIYATEMCIRYFIFNKNETLLNFPDPEYEPPIKTFDIKRFLIEKNTEEAFTEENIRKRSITIGRTIRPIKI